MPDQSAGVQNAAFTRGLQQVLVRLSGDNDILDKLELPPARGYVKQFRYDSIETEIGGEASMNPEVQQLQLWIQYDEDRLVKLLRSNAIPVWSTRRDSSVIWFAVRDGMQHYLLREQDESQLKQATEAAAAARGVPLSWPRYDSKDKARVRFADIWGGFATQVRKASERYGNGPVIVANMAWNGSGWVGEWYLFDASINRHWQVNNADYATLIRMGMDKVADELGSRYALLETTDIQDASRLRIEFQGVDSIDAFKRVSRILRQHPAVKAAQPFEINLDAVMFDVYLRTDEKDFLDRMSRNRGLRQVYQVPDIGTGATTPLPQPAGAVSIEPSADAAVDPNAGLLQPVMVPPPAADYRYRLLDSRS